MSKALLIIDIQNDYFTGGAKALVGSDLAASKARELLDKCRSTGVPVIHIQHFATSPNATFFIPGTQGVEINECVRPATGEKVIPKNYPSSFQKTQLHEYLQSLGVTHLLVAGMMTHMCVDTTVRAAFELGYSCTLAHDACATLDLTFDGKVTAAADVHNSYIAALHGTFADALAVSEIGSVDS